jgi:hypothetical protein
MSKPGQPRDEGRHWSEETSFVRLGEIVARLKGDVERAYNARQEEAGADAHDALVSAEWRMRVAEKRGRE